MGDLKNHIGNIKKIVDYALSEYVSVRSCKINDNILEAMSYSLLTGGKRIRSVLCIGTAEALGDGINNNIVSIACAIEMIHAYSLIHDDLPIMDNDVLRRGKLTSHKYFDEATAILAGNALLTLAFEIISEIGLNDKGLVSYNMLKIMYILSSAVGFSGMMGGQMMDISSEGNNLSEIQIKNMHHCKTGIFIDAAINCGAFAVNANKVQIKKLKVYAFNFGIAFQVVDDILNVTSTLEKMGKPVKSDHERGKNTYPSIMGIEVSKRLVIKLIDKALVSIECFGKKARTLKFIANYILRKCI